MQVGWDTRHHSAKENLEGRKSGERCPSRQFARDHHQPSSAIATQSNASAEAAGVAGRRSRMNSGRRRDLTETSSLRCSASDSPEQGGCGGGSRDLAGRVGRSGAVEDTRFPRGPSCQSFSTLTFTPKATVERTDTQNCTGPPAGRPIPMTGL